MSLISKGLVRVFLSIGVFSMVACSHIDEETPRSFVSRVVTDTRQERDEIAAELLAGSKTIRLAGPLVLKERVGIKPAPIDFAWISTTGTLVVHSKSHAVVLVLEPTVSKSVVQWNCVTYPSNAKPNVC